jgi:Flp pilus assembly protein TadG
MALKTRKESGQALILFTILVPIIAIAGMALLDYSVALLRTQELSSAADLAAHAGAQEVTVGADGALTMKSDAASAVAAYFNAQAPSYAQLTAVSCGVQEGVPACSVEAQTSTPGFLGALLPSRPITVTATGYLVQGVTRGEQ